MPFKEHQFFFDASFEKFSLLSKDEIKDLVNLFYKFGPTAWTFTCEPAGKDKNLHGEHATNASCSFHRIALVEKRIVKSFGKKNITMGGNRIPPTAKAAAAFVLVHEIQHANQVRYHDHGEAFYNEHRYRNKDCEREARQYVDEKEEEILAYLGIETEKKNKVVVRKKDDEFDSIADVLCECKEISIDDVKDELRYSGILSPTNVQRLLGVLQKRGINFTQA